MYKFRSKAVKNMILTKGYTMYYFMYSTIEIMYSKS